MTLENNERLLEFFESKGLKDKAKAMRAHIEKKTQRIKQQVAAGNPLYMKYAKRFSEPEKNILEKIQETKKNVKK